MRIPSVLVAGGAGAETRALVDGFEQDGYEVFLAVGTLEALAFASRMDFDLVVVDEAPGLEPVLLSRALRALKPGVDPQHGRPIVVLSASGTIGDAQAAFAGGATDFMTKPCALSQVRARVRQWLARTRIASRRPGSVSRGPLARTA